MDANFDLTKYVSTHNVGGAVMGDNPNTSALNRYLQSWDVHNVFVPGGNGFPTEFPSEPYRHHWRDHLNGCTSD